MKLIFLMAMLVSATTFAATSKQGKEGGNGGDEVGLELQMAVATAMTRIQNMDQVMYAKIAKPVEAALKRASFVAVDDALDVRVKDLIQNSVAINFPDTGLVMVNRSRWNAIPDTNLMEGIALHEILSLAKLEQTGTYPYSSKYVAMLNVHAGKLDEALTVNRIKQISALNPGSVPFDILKTFFEEAITPMSLDDIDFDENKLQCQIVWRGYPLKYQGENVGVNDQVTTQKLVKELVTTKDEVIDRGPLMPGSPSIKEWRLNFTYGSGEHLIENFIGSSLEKKSNGLVQETLGFQMGLSFGNATLGSNLKSSLKTYFRKNNGLLTFHFDYAPSLDPKYYLRLNTYGYCYKK